MSKVTPPTLYAIVCPSDEGDVFIQFKNKISSTTVLYPAFSVIPDLFSSYDEAVRKCNTVIEIGTSDNSKVLRSAEVIDLRLIPVGKIPTDILRGHLHYDGVTRSMKKLAGKVLTILDAAYVNENQNKAVKDLVKTSFRSQLSDMWERAFSDGGVCESEGPESKDVLD